MSDYHPLDERAEGYELELTIRVRYKVDPKNYIVADNGDDITAYELARIDAGNFRDDPEMMFDMLVEKGVLTVAPIVTFD
jgi:hypothetical protein